ncbi:hypothetical protein AOQ84DRAFT_408710 [Glonium stellatum]|uniref:Alkylmercury lyase n=1 Tax=Glonium stellatum TaxID=574774 RepID=A0A8E2JS67_9PEZI|nr:hypothetical protein AOQ84DRAFT_408710 [Glonium stellatum]
MDDDVRSVRYFIFTFFLENCRPPSLEDICAACEVSEDRSLEILAALEKGRHLVLHKKDVHSPTPISMVHPFSHLPTSFIVTHEDRSWWANCAWCAFGLASMLAPAAVQIHTRSGSIGKEMSFEVANDKVTLISEKSAEKPCVHFAVPLKSWWTDVRFACGTIQLFDSEEEALAWPKKRGFNEGELMSLDTLWKLSKIWYHDKHTYEYCRKSSDEVIKLFEDLGLTSTFWRP